MRWTTQRTGLIPGRDNNISLLSIITNGPGTHPVSYGMNNKNSIGAGKMARM
jgi:hypothetical protein